MVRNEARSDGELADPGTRLGQLQRGRGAGFLAALSAGEAGVADVLAAAAFDPRWDRQIESRAGHYAALLHALGADPGPLAVRIAEVGARTEGDSWDAWLPIEVLARLADRGDARAAGMLADAIADGPLWRASLDAVAAVGGEALLRRTIPTAAIHQLVARVSAQELAEAIREPDDPLAAWLSEVPALRFVAARDSGDAPRTLDGPAEWVAGRIRVPPSSVDASMSTEELLTHTEPAALRRIVEILDQRRDEATTARLVRAVDERNPRQALMALSALGRRGCQDFVDLAEGHLRALTAEPPAVGRRDPMFLGYSRYLAALPPEAVLTRARGWFDEEWPLGNVGQNVLARHATEDDLPLLHTAGAAALAAGEMYRLCSILEALTTVGSVRSLNVLCAAYEGAPYSWARQRALEGLARLPGETSAQAAMHEALWDCEEESRCVACTHVDRALPGVRSRLRALANDPFEEAEVRDAALARQP